MAWRIGTDDPAALFVQHGWDVQVQHPGEEGANYNPQRFPNQPGQLLEFSRCRVPHLTVVVCNAVASDRFGQFWFLI